MSEKREMEKFLLALFTFALTGVLGNWLTRTWQERHWVAQQRFLGREKEFLALRELAEEIGRALGGRIYYMQRLALSLPSGDKDQIGVRAKEHDEQVKQWNERLSSFYVRLPILMNAELGNRLESTFQAPMADLSIRLDRLAHGKVPLEQRAEAIKRLVSELNALQGRGIAFNKRLINIVESRRNEIYFGTRVPFTRWTLEKFSTWQLVKAVFISKIDSHAVVRSPLDT